MAMEDMLMPSHVVDNWFMPLSPRQARWEQTQNSNGLQSHLSQVKTYHSGVSRMPQAKASLKRGHAETVGVDDNPTRQKKLHDRGSAITQSSSGPAQGFAYPKEPLTGAYVDDLVPGCQDPWKQTRPVPSGLAAQADPHNQQPPYASETAAHDGDQVCFPAALTPLEQLTAGIYPVSLAGPSEHSTRESIAGPLLDVCTTSVQQLEPAQCQGLLHDQHLLQAAGGSLDHQIVSPSTVPLECSVNTLHSQEEYLTGTSSDVTGRKVVLAPCHCPAVNEQPRLPLSFTNNQFELITDRLRSGPTSEVSYSGLPKSTLSSLTLNHNTGIARFHQSYVVPAASQFLDCANLRHSHVRHQFDTVGAAAYASLSPFPHPVACGICLVNTFVAPQLPLSGQDSRWTHLLGWPTGCGASTGIQLASPSQTTRSEAVTSATGGQIAQLSAMAATFESQDEELARMQELSNSWQPEVSGPLVSQRLPSSTLTREYASADPVYQIKTVSLQHKYAEYRTCRGDGHCGWRAIAFSYFEVLHRLGDKPKLIAEEQRLVALEHLLQQVGLQKHIYEDFLDETLELLRTLATGNDNGESLLEAFNDESRSQSIITFFKLLTSTWLRTHPDDYQPYLELPLDDYCKLRIDPAVSELEQIGLTALVDVLIKPAGIGAEVLYLDRNVGEDVDVYAYEPLDEHGKPIPHHPWFHLLYRPGHYDILYKAKDLPSTSIAPLPTTQDVLVGFSRGQNVRLDTPASLGFVANNYEIPGMGYFPGQQSGSKSWDLIDGHLNYRSSQAQSPPATMDAARSLPLRTSSVPQVQTANVRFPELMNGSAPSSSVMSPASPLSPGFAPVIDSSRFRPSKFEFEREYNASKGGTPVYQTPIFKNSHFNLAHFNNPEFTPEQWKPELEYKETKRKRSAD